METEQSDATNYEKVRTLDHSLRKIFLIQVFINTLRVLCKNTDKISSLDCNLFEIVFVNRQNLKHFKFISLWQKSSFKVYKTFLLDIFKNHLREKIWILAQAIEQCFQKKKKKKCQIHQNSSRCHPKFHPRLLSKKIQSVYKAATHFWSAMNF